jgi:hypothetical protein
MAKSLVFGSGVESGLSFIYFQAGAIGEKTLPFIGTLFLALAGVMLFSTQLGVLESSSRIISEKCHAFVL